eukprot:TRINITY_DN12335_c0_g1_i1.p2 TRINITY_DN12335_c0_g1~~TRINITY_DN12335_c0_g1_i1.p2  ORF type:complete len:95 (+),score=16.07 TRINITY_DN12335_c0_g1_i1:175-459(+)
MIRSDEVLVPSFVDSSWLRDIPELCPESIPERLDFCDLIGTECAYEEVLCCEGTLQEFSEYIFEATCEYDGWRLKVFRIRCACDNSSSPGSTSN